MRTTKIEINNLNFLDTTSKYVVANDEYHGIIVMDTSLNEVRRIELDDDIVVTCSVKHNDEMLLFCYEEECAFYVDLDKSIVHKFDLKDYEGVYFSRIYFWENDTVYLFADNGDKCVIVDLNSMKMLRSSSAELSESGYFDLFVELNNENILSYDHDSNSGLTVRNSHYHILNCKSKTADDMFIPFLQQEEGIPSNQVYYVMGFLNDMVLCLSELRMKVSVKDGADFFIDPPYELYRFFGAKVMSVDGRTIIFAMSCDNSAEGPTLLLRYEY